MAGNVGSLRLNTMKNSVLQTTLQARNCYMWLTAANIGQGRGQTLPSSQKLLLDCKTRGCEDRRGSFLRACRDELGKPGPMLMVFTLSNHSNLNASISSADVTQAL